MRYIVFILAVTGLLALCLGCGSAEPVEPQFDTKTGIGSVNVTIDDSKFTPEIIEVKSGQRVRLLVTNKSATKDRSVSIGDTAVKENGLPNGAVNTVYLIRSEGLVLCHLGLLSQHLTPTQLELLRQTQILIAPIAPGRTLSFGEIQEIISAIQPRILIPLEYNPEKTSETHFKFLSEVGASDAQPVNRFNVTETNLPADLQTVILNEQS